MTLLIFIAGLVALVAGAELLVRGASKLALSFGISPLVVGLTVVAFGTSAPEVAVSVGAVLDGTDRHRRRQRGRQQHLQRAVHPRPVGADHAAGGQRPAHPPGGADHDRRLAAAAGAGARRPARPASTARCCSRCCSPTPCSWSAVARRDAGRAATSTPAESEPAAARRLGRARCRCRLLLIVVGLGLLVFGSDWLVSSAVVLRQGAGRQRPGDRPDHRRRRHLDARGGHLGHGGAQGRARHRGRQRGRQQHLQHPRLPGHLGAGGRQAGLAMPPSLLTFDIWVMLAVALACLPVFVTGREIARWEGARVPAVLHGLRGLPDPRPSAAALGSCSNAVLGFVVPTVSCWCFVLPHSPLRARCRSPVMLSAQPKVPVSAHGRSKRYRSARRECSSVSRGAVLPWLALLPFAAALVLVAVRNGQRRLAACWRARVPCSAACCSLAGAGRVRRRGAALVGAPGCPRSGLRLRLPHRRPGLAVRAADLRHRRAGGAVRRLLPRRRATRRRASSSSCCSSWARCSAWCWPTTCCCWWCSGS